MRKYANGSYVDLTKEEILEYRLQEAQGLKQAKMLQTKAYIQHKPRVSVTLSDTLTIVVDGGRDNKDDFKSKWELMQEDDVTTVRDADNAFHGGITKSQMEQIWKAIVLNGEDMYARKWQKEAQLQAIEIPAYDLESIDTSDEAIDIYIDEIVLKIAEISAVEM